MRRRLAAAKAAERSSGRAAQLAARAASRATLLKKELAWYVKEDQATENDVTSPSWDSGISE